MLTIIALLNLIGIIAASANLAQPYVLLGLVILNGIFLAIKDLILNKCIEARMNGLKSLSEEISDSLRNEHIQLIKGFLPTAVQAHLKAHLPIFREVVREAAPLSRIASAHTSRAPRPESVGGVDTRDVAGVSAPPELESPEDTANTPSTHR